MIPPPPNPTPQAFCALHRACSEGEAFAVQFPTMAEVWENCNSVDWLLWICNKHNVELEDKALRLFAVWCAHSCNATDPRSIECVNVAERFANGEATEKELSAAEAAAEAAAWSAAEVSSAVSSVVSSAVSAVSSSVVSAVSSVVSSSVVSAVSSVVSSGGSSGGHPMRSI